MFVRHPGCLTMLSNCYNCYWLKIRRQVEVRVARERAEAEFRMAQERAMHEASIKTEYQRVFMAGFAWGVGHNGNRQTSKDCLPEIGSK